jgi:hypothetical protein
VSSKQRGDEKRCRKKGGKSKEKREKKCRKKEKMLKKKINICIYIYFIYIYILPICVCIYGENTENLPKLYLKISTSKSSTYYKLEMIHHIQVFFNNIKNKINNV